jgi:hypothetical protein
LIPNAKLIEPARWDTHDWWRLWTKGEHFAVWRELVPDIVEFLEEEQS